MNKKKLFLKSTEKKSKSKLTDTVITHIYLHDKYLNAIPKIPNLHNVVVLYLYSNEITDIKNLEDATNLTSLYLQKNRIFKIENLTNLQKLKKLYMGQNTISVVEGLQNLSLLEELHLEKQFLNEGNCLCFDPRSIFNISRTLQVLNISHNKIQSITCLAPLRALKVLNASHNELNDVEEICKLLNQWFYIKDLNFLHNPIVKKRLYKENVISSTYCIEILDTKPVSDSTRNFLKRLHHERISNNLKKPTNLADHFSELPNNYPVSVQKAASASIIQQKLFNENTEIFDEKNAVHIPWKLLPKPSMTPMLKVLKSKKSILKRPSNIDSRFENLKI